MVKSHWSILGATVLALGCSSSSGSADGEAAPELAGSGDLNALIEGAPECADRGSDTCKDLVGTVLFRGLFFEEGPAAAGLGTRATGLSSNVDTTGLTRRLSQLAESRARYCSEPGSHCAEPGAAPVNEALSGLAASIEEGSVSSATLEAALSDWLADPDTERFIDGMRRVEPRAFVDFAERMTSGNPVAVSEGLRAVSDVLLTSLVATVDPNADVLKQVFPPGPGPLDPVVDIETAIYVVVVVAVAVAITLVVPAVEEPFATSLENTRFVGRATDEYSGLLSN